MKILVGLGNPGRKYINTYHNIGFSVIDSISKDKKIPVKNEKFNSLMGKGRIFSEEVILLKPKTYMNLSGLALGLIVSKKALSLDNILVVCDDVNLPLGHIRLRASGSDGGHKGLKSISETLKSNKYARLRVGVGKPEDNDRDLASYVLRRPDSLSSKILKKAVLLAKEAAYIWLREGMTASMNKFNRRLDSD